MNFFFSEQAPFPYHTLKPILILLRVTISGIYISFNGEKGGEEGKSKHKVGRCKHIFIVGATTDVVCKQIRQWGRDQEESLAKALPSARCTHKARAGFLPLNILAKDVMGRDPPFILLNEVFKDYFMEKQEHKNYAQANRPPCLTEKA